ncbi:MAG: replicative DNA helicase, partial [Opitutales bacterium]|nr:replicative DNA helicase [Opitutales bacterium]
MREENPKKTVGARGSLKTRAAAANAESLIGRELPHNSDAEQGLLASMLLDGSGEVLNVCIASKLKEDYFYYAPHRKIFRAILSLFNEGKPIDEIVLADRLEASGELESVGGAAKIAEISGRVETYAHFKHWLEIVREKYFFRALILTCHETIELADQNIDSLNAFFEGVESKFLSISQDRISDTARHIGEQVEGAISMVNQLILNRGEISGVSTGFKDLDDMTRGLHGKEMIVIAGRPGTGKTSIALNIAESAIFAKKPVPTLVFSLEMGAEQLIMRMLCARAGINQHKLRQGHIANDQTQDIQKAGLEMRAAPLWIDDTADITILEMRAKARRLKQQHNIGLIVVDYLQLLKAVDSRAPREQQIAEMSRGMKAMAKELDVPVIVLAQLNRKTEEEQRDPRASDLRESGAIEQDADVILLLSWQRKSAKDNAENELSLDSRLVKLIIAKQRSGPTGEI